MPQKLQLSCVKALVYYRLGEEKRVRGKFFAREKCWKIAPAWQMDTMRDLPVFLF